MATRAIPVLMYHSISDQATPRYRPYCLPPRVFESHMAYLRDQRYTPVTVTQFAAALVDSGADLPPRPIVLTFDDGLADFYTGALPALAQHGFVSTLFVVSGYVGGTSRWLEPEGEGQRPMLSWAQLAEVARHGVEIGAHGHTHRALDILPRAVAKDEVVRSKALLEQRLGQPVTSFAYPHGYYGGAVRAMVEAAGYSASCAVKHAMSARSDDRLALARLIVNGDTSVDHLTGLLEGQNLRVAPPGELLRTRVWRYVRRTRGHFGRALAPRWAA